jgi:predicted Holliday junction resolvase-like endonuclease
LDAGIIIVAIILILLIIFIAIYNSLMVLRNQVKNTRGQINTKLKRRLLNSRFVALLLCIILFGSEAKIIIFPY